MAAIVEHSATVENVGEDFVGVVMQPQTACAACKAKNICGPDESERRIVVYTADAPQYSVGESVMVSVSKAMSLRAVAVAYIYPFMLMLAVLLTLIELGAGELAAGLSALGALAVYYLAIWLVRRKFDDQIVFSIRKS